MRTRVRTVAALVPILVSALSAPIEARQAPLDAGFEVVGPTFVAVLVDDLEAAVAWYADAFGLETVNAIDGPEGGYAIRLLSDGVVSVELIRLEGVGPPSAERHLGLFKAGLWVDDIVAAHAWMRVRSSGADDAIFVDESLGARSFVLRDPFGNRLQLFQSCGTACGGASPVP